MAALSSKKGYFIDGTELPKSAYPTSVKPSHNLVSRSWNNMYGNFKDIPVNSKLKINWIFDYVYESDLEKVWGYIYNKILTQKSRFFDIVTYFPGIGFVEGTFYLGTPTNFTSKDTQCNDGSANWWSMELHWIEVDGIVLNSPTQVAQASVIVNNKDMAFEEAGRMLLGSGGGALDGYTNR